MEIKTKTFLPFTHDFIFSRVMKDPEICMGILERILPEEKFSDICVLTNEVDKLCSDPVSIDTQKTLIFNDDAHGVRFDAYIEAEDLRIEIEMQTYTQRVLSKRSRYYHSNIDMDSLASRQPYDQLPKVYVIFICTFDYLKQGEPVYHFRGYDALTETYLDDDTHTIILNAACDLEKVPDRLRPLYAYIQDPHNISDWFIRKLDAEVIKYNSNEWRKKQMTFDQLLQEREEIGKEIGKEIGEDRVNQLHAKLLDEKRIDDLKRSTEDPEYQNKLFAEFGL